MQWKEKSRIMFQVFDSQAYVTKNMSMWWPVRACPIVVNAGGFGVVHLSVRLSVGRPFDGVGSIPGRAPVV